MESSIRDLNKSVYQCVGPGDRVIPDAESESNDLNKCNGDSFMKHEDSEAIRRSTPDFPTRNEDERVRYIQIKHRPKVRPKSGSFIAQQRELLREGECTDGPNIKHGNIMDNFKQKSRYISETSNYQTYRTVSRKETADVPIHREYHNSIDRAFENDGRKKEENHFGKPSNSAVISVSSSDFDDDDTQSSHVSSTHYQVSEETPQTRPFYELIQHTPPMSLSESDLSVPKTLTTYNNILVTSKAQEQENMGSRNIRKSLSFNDRPRNSAYISGPYDSKKPTQVHRAIHIQGESCRNTDVTHQNHQQKQIMQSKSGSSLTQEMRWKVKFDKLNEGCTRDHTIIAKEMKTSSEKPDYSSRSFREDENATLNESLYNLGDSFPLVQRTREEETLEMKPQIKSSSGSSFESSALLNASKSHKKLSEGTYGKRPSCELNKHTPQVSASDSNLSWLMNTTECKDIPDDVTSHRHKERVSKNKIRNTVSFNDESRRPHYTTSTFDRQKLTRIVQAGSNGEGATDINYSTNSEVRDTYNTRSSCMRNFSSSLASVTEKKKQEEGAEEEKDAAEEEETKGERLVIPRTAGGAVIQAGDYHCDQIISSGTYVQHYEHKEIGTLNTIKIVKKTRRKSRTLTNIIDTTAITLAERTRHLYQTKLIRDETSRMRNESDQALVILQGDGSTTAGMAILDKLSSDGKTIPLILHEPSQWAKVGMDKGYAILIKYEKQWDPYLDTIVACTKARKVHAILLLPSKEALENLIVTNKKTMDSVKHTVVSYTERYECTVDERVNILRSKQEFVGLTHEELKTIAMTTPASVFFEYLKTYARSPKAIESTVEFFQNPLSCLVDKIDSLSRHTEAPIYRELYYVLSAVALSGGVLTFNDSFKCILPSKFSRVASVFQKAISCSSTMFEPGFIEAKFSETMKKIESSLGLVNTPSSSKMLDIAKLWGKDYCNVDESRRCTFIGQSVYLSVCLSLMHIIPTEFLQIVDISFIKRFVRDEMYQPKPFETVFKLSSEQYKVISKRFLKEILSRKVRDVIDHPLFDNQEFVDSFFVEIDRMGWRYMQILTSREVSEGNTVIFYGADKDSTDIVSRICRKKGWRYSSSNSSILRAFRGSSGTHLLVQEQNYKTLLKVSSRGKEEAFKSLTDLGTPVTKQCLLNAVSSRNVQLVCNAIKQNHWDLSVLSTILVHACKTCVEARFQNCCYTDHDNDLPALVKCLLDCGCNPNEVSDDNMLPVETAVKDNNVNLLKLLLKAGAKVNVVDNKRRGKCILHDAIEVGNEEMVAVLLAQGMDPNKRDSQFRTPILHAVDRQNAKIVKTLLQWDGDPNMVDRCQRYPLHIACQSTDEDVVNALVQGGAKVQVRDRQMCTPMYIASTHVHLGIVRCLQDSGARDKNCAFFAVEQRMKNLLEILMLDFRATNDSGKTILEVSIENRYHEITEHLIERGCDVSIIKSRGYSLLVFAIIQDNWNLFQTLVAHGANVQSVDEEENTVLHIACALGHLFMARNILCSYPNLLQATTKKEWTPLHISAFFGKDQMVELLLDRDADRNSMTKFGETPLYLVRSRRLHYEGRERLYKKYPIQMGSKESFERCEGLLTHQGSQM